MNEEDRAERARSREPEENKPMATDVVTIDSDSVSDSQGK